MASPNDCLNYITRSGRNLRKIVTNLFGTSSRKPRGSQAKMNVIPDDDPRQRQREETERYRAEIAALNQQLADRTASENEARVQLQQIQQQLQELQQQQQQNQRNEDRRQVEHQVQNENVVVPPQRDYAAEFVALIGNVQVNQIDVSIPSFSDENSVNPLEFLDEVERYFRMRQIANDRKVHIVTMFLKNKTRSWIELQNVFENYDQFKTAFTDKFCTVEVQVKTKNRWLNNRFNPQQHENLQSFFTHNYENLTLSDLKCQFMKRITQLFNSYRNQLEWR